MTEQPKRQVPQNELDLALLTTDSVWGKPDVSQELKDNLSTYRKIIVENPDGSKTEGYTKESLWGVLNYYTRDMRLANLDRFQEDYVKHYIDLAGDCLQEGLKRAFIISLSRAATILELSQSRMGFLRKRLGTLSTESYTEQKEPPQRSFFGMAKKKS